MFLEDSIVCMYGMVTNGKNDENSKELLQEFVQSFSFKKTLFSDVKPATASKTTKIRLKYESWEEMTLTSCINLIFLVFCGNGMKVTYKDEEQIANKFGQKFAENRLPTFWIFIGVHCYCLFITKERSVL